MRVPPLTPPPPKNPPDLFDVGDVRMVLGGHQQQLQALIELDAIEGGDTHVEEDPEEHGQRDLPQQVPNDDGQAWARVQSATVPREGPPGVPAAPRAQSSPLAPLLPRLGRNLCH